MFTQNPEKEFVLNTKTPTPNKSINLPLIEMFYKGWDTESVDVS